MLTSEECWKMVNEKKCIGYIKNEKKMRCINDACYYDIQPTSEYSRGSTIVKQIINCQFKKHFIESENQSVPKFKTDNCCKYSDKYCDLQNSIVVWNIGIYHECPFEYVNIIDLIAVGTGGVFLPPEKNFLFMIPYQQFNQDFSEKNRKMQKVSFLSKYGKIVSNICFEKWTTCSNKYNPSKK